MDEFLGTAVSMEDSLRQQQRQAEPERMASEFPDGAQHMPGAQHEGRSRTHERQGSVDSRMKGIAQKRPDSVPREASRRE